MILFCELTRQDVNDKTNRKIPAVSRHYSKRRSINRLNLLGDSLRRVKKKRNVQCANPCGCYMIQRQDRLMNNCGATKLQKNNPPCELRNSRTTSQTMMRSDATIQIPSSLAKQKQVSWVSTQSYFELKEKPMHHQINYAKKERPEESSRVRANAVCRNHARKFKPCVNRRSGMLKVCFLVLLALASSCTDTHAKEANKIGTVAPELFFPESDSDWKRLKASDLNWNELALKDMLRYAGGQKSSAILVLWRGQIVVERYWNVAGSQKYKIKLHGKDNQGHALEDVASIQKSLAAILLGIALDKKLLNLDDPVTKHLGEGWSNASLAEESEIKLKHLISMSSGLNDQLEFQSKPDRRWKYNTNAYSQIVNVLEAASGLDRKLLTEQWLSALQMKNSSWKVRRFATIDPKSNHHGWVTSARDLARLGLLVLANGDWAGQPVVKDKNYIREMLESSQSLNPSYGYLWWLNGKSHTVRAGRFREGPLNPNAPQEMVAGLGALGRRLYVVPNLDLVMVRLGDQPEVNFDTQLWAYFSKVLDR